MLLLINKGTQVSLLINGNQFSILLQKIQHTEDRELELRAPIFRLSCPIICRLCSCCDHTTRAERKMLAHILYDQVTPIGNLRQFFYMGYCHIPSIN